MTWIFIIIVGGVLGWIASKIMHTDAQQGIILNIVVGIVGAALRDGCFRRCSALPRSTPAIFRSPLCWFSLWRGRPARDRQSHPSRQGPLNRTQRVELPSRAAAAARPIACP
jgi:uncharacterized membrane protein YeaQ/YmgE (transglycosylase-associated protein family)